jgi:hypothetical protein
VERANVGGVAKGPSIGCKGGDLLDRTAGPTVLLSQYDPGRELEDLLNAKLISPGNRPRIERHDVSRGAIKAWSAWGSASVSCWNPILVQIFPILVYRELHDGMGPARIGFSAAWRADNDNPALTSFLKLLAERYPIFSAT